MGKDFFEVFPTLNLPEDVRFLLKDVRVTKVATNSTRDFIRFLLIYYRKKRFMSWSIRSSISFLTARQFR